MVSYNKIIIKPITYNNKSSTYNNISSTYNNILNQSFNFKMTSLLEKYTNPDFSPLTSEQREQVANFRRSIKHAGKTLPEGWTLRSSSDWYIFSSLKTLLLRKDFNQAAIIFQSVASKWINQIFDNRRELRTKLVNARKVSSIFKYMAKEKPEKYDLISSRLVQLLLEIASAGTYSENDMKLIISKFIMHLLIRLECIKLEFVMPNY